LSPDEFRLLLQRNGLGEVADAMLATARKCIRFDATGEPFNATGAGLSKIGGLPDLPRNVDWPHWNKRPLAFLAQIAFSELPAIDDPLKLPQTGLLSFFYDVVEQPWGYDPKNSGSSCVVFTAGSHDVERRAAPAELPEEAQLLELQLSAQEHYSLPGWESDEIHSLNLSETQMDAFDAVKSELTPEYPSTCHQLLGWPDEIQGPMELECQLVTNGLYCGDETGYKDPRAVELAPRAKDWRLLLQLDSDDNAGMMWGDAGRLYFWIREQDLIALSFDATWTILQCY
jgi:uncharacterized protein YwqG